MQRLVYQEVLLLPTEGRYHLGDVLIEVLAHGCRCLINFRQRLQQWHLVVQCEASIADEDGRDAQGVLPNKGWRGGIPKGVTAGLECIADAAIRE